MPYKIALEDGVLRIALTDHLTASEFHALADEAPRYERGVPRVPHRITDMRGITRLGIHYPEVQDFAWKRRALSFPNSFKSAIIATDSAHLGYARMFQMLNDNPQIAIRIFPDEPSANDWINCPESSHKR